ncbi:MAG: ribonuclease, partial [Clostridia bacterium]|nr:ribonuclease [Clostridia bacterium]
KEDVALYLWTYGELPVNFMTKNEARKLGWQGGGLDDYAPDMCIGGDSFGNREGILPNTYKYIECDIDTLNKDQRGAKRLVFSKGCEVIYYTDDHYESFELLYGEE